MKKIIYSIIILFGTLFSIQSYSNENKSAGKSLIDLSPNKPVHKLFPLTLISINGKSVNHRNDMMMLEPGKYQLKFLSNINLGFFAEGDRILRTKINQRKYEDSLELVVEAEHSYQLGFDASSKKIEEWKPVILSTTDRNTK